MISARLPAEQGALVVKASVSKQRPNIQTRLLSDPKICLLDWGSSYTKRPFFGEDAWGIMKVLTTTALLFLPVISSAQYFADEWQAFFSERSCFVGIKVSQGNERDDDFLEAKVSFYRPHSEADRRPKKHPDVKAEPVILYVQVLPLWSSIDEMPLSAVEVRYGDISAKLTHDPSVHGSGMPAYLLGGREAASAWEHLKGDHGLYLVLTYSPDQQVEIAVSPKRIKVASAMYDACVAVSTDSTGM